MTKACAAETYPTAASSGQYTHPDGIWYGNTLLQHDGVTDRLYGGDGNDSLFGGKSADLLARWGLSHSLVDQTDLDAVRLERTAQASLRTAPFPP